ncbi:hypothetical protein OK351_02155 [Glutamicibacter sp. MNS18]|uniref:hypothetical protein n=1 Tax=Glutamicibacter sp. MNS18 TaxID=2989817 RepID=UPI0022365690|nr:hypothetical protein [Glutamicibacter sp. MNS18]MCW4464314.1 hypothetical protein [Glutamicibacter sp. MNS18]
MSGPAAKSRTTRGHNLGALWRAAVVAVAAGVLGSVIHASLFYLGDIPVMWGVGLAWLFLGLLVYWAAVASSRLWGGALGFIGCYVVVGLLSFSGNDQLITPMALYDYMPGPALASALWMYGMLVPALIALPLALRALRRESRQSA